MTRPTVIVLTVLTILLFMAAVTNLDITFSCINCNSLNMSKTTTTNQKRNVYGISKLKTDIIFLSDIRLANRNLTTNTEQIANFFRVNPYCSYKLVFNSTKNKRGTGILIKSSLQFTELGRVADVDTRNFILIKANIQGNILITGSIYGPNEYCPEFFVNLKNGIQTLGD